jgi:YesN/AraC family two-component response regulator
MIKIGLVEDNHSTLKALEEKLSFYEDLQIVFTAKDGKEAIELLSKILTLIFY